ncbi:hypothetical protein DXG01_001079 [Tephrocybe rancida]|nr:hypothetical protein DXG01_001079 [Tephrocybe rancida]
MLPSLSSVKGEYELTKEQDEVLCKAWNTVYKSEKKFQEMKENFELLNEFRDKAQKVSIKSDLVRIDFVHLDGSQALGHNDQGITDLLNGPDSHWGLEIVDRHSGKACTPKGNGQDESTSVAPMKSMSHKQIKLEIKKLKWLAKLEESKG